MLECRCRYCSELISCSHHLSIQSAIMSSSPITFRASDNDCSAEQLNDVTAETDSMETASMCHFHGDSDEEGDECVSVSACDACDERQRVALLDSPPVTVLTGTHVSSLSLSSLVHMSPHCHCAYWYTLSHHSHCPHWYTCLILSLIHI